VAESTHNRNEFAVLVDNGLLLFLKYDFYVHNTLKPRPFRRVDLLSILILSTSFDSSGFVKKVYFKY